MRKILLTAAALLALAGSAHAASTITGADLLVDQAKLAGQEVMIDANKIFGADNSGAIVHLGSVTAKILWQDADPQTMRWILTRCGRDGDGCTGHISLYVTPTGKNWGSWPALIKVRAAQ